MIQVHILLFAGIRDGIGQDKLSLQVQDGTRLKKLMEDLHQQYPELLNLFLSCQFIVNCSVIDPEYQLQDQDEIAILPPLGGG